jgi:hypothetical protein
MLPAISISTVDSTASNNPRTSTFQAVSMCKRKRRESAFSLICSIGPRPDATQSRTCPCWVTSVSVPFEPHPPAGAKSAPPTPLERLSPALHQETDTVLLLSSMHAYQAKPSPSPTKLIPSRLALLLCIRGGVQARATLSAVHLLVRGAEVPLADVDIPRRQDTGRGA